MNSSVALHVHDKDTPTATLVAGDHTYGFVKVDLNSQLATSPAVLFINQPAYLDGLVRELTRVQAAWAILRGEPVDA